MILPPLLRRVLICTAILEADGKHRSRACHEKNDIAIIARREQPANVYEQRDRLHKNEARKMTQMSVL